MRRNSVYFLLLCSDMENRLFGEVVFGPVKSRRLGLSLGINILPADKKICSFNCIYCECGWNTSGPGLSFVPRDIVAKEMETRFSSAAVTRESIDVITFAGNGEPTLHPDFSGIIEDTLRLRDQYLPGIPVAVLSNSTMLFNEEVRNALLKCDMPILKLDSAIESTCRLLNQPTGYFNLRNTIEQLKQFEGRCIIQTMFVRGQYNQQAFDNTTPEELQALIQAIKAIAPSYVMIYTIDRDTPAEQIQRISAEELKRIAAIIRSEGIEVNISD